MYNADFIATACRAGIDFLGTAEMSTVDVTGSDLTIEQTVQLAEKCAQLSVSDQAWAKIARGRDIVDRIVASGETVYGITTGLGAQKVYGVADDEMDAFNNRVLQAHASQPAGSFLSRKAVRAATAVLINQFATGTNSVRPALVTLLVNALNEDLVPEVTAEGSIGSADLTPMSQLATGVLAAAPGGTGFRISAKEAVALMNNNATSLGRGTLVLDDAARLFASFDLAAAMALEGFQGTPTPYRDAPLRSLRRAGRQGSAERIRGFLAGSRLWQPDVPRFIQDPLSFRCVPAIHGTADRALRHIQEDWTGELNVSNDNPMMDLDEGLSVSHGNMESSGETLAMDSLRLLAAKLSNVSGERQHKLHWPAFSGLTEGLSDAATAFGGIDFLNLGHIATGFVGKVSSLSHPVITIGAGQVCNGIEDAAGFAMQSVALTEAASEAAWMVVSLEMIVATWAVQRRGVPQGDLGRGVAAACEALRPHLPIGREGEARFDLRPIVAAVRSGEILNRAMAVPSAAAPKASA